MAGMAVADAKTTLKPCVGKQKGFVRNAKTKKCEPKKKTTKKTTKKVVATTKAPVAAAKGTLTFGGIYYSIDRQGLPTPKEVQAIGDAWAQQVNSRGGINGYKVAIEWRDSKYDTARFVQGVKELDQDGVLAIAGSDGYTQVPAADSYIQKVSLPFVGGAPYAPEYDNHPMFFPVSGSQYAGSWGSMVTPINLGFKRLADFHCFGIAAGDSFPTGISQCCSPRHSHIASPLRGFAVSPTRCCYYSISRDVCLTSSAIPSSLAISSTAAKTSPIP